MDHRFMVLRATTLAGIGIGIALIYRPGWVWLPLLLYAAGSALSLYLGSKKLPRKRYRYREKPLRFASGWLVMAFTVTTWLPLSNIIIASPAMILGIGIALVVIGIDLVVSGGWMLQVPTRT